MKRERIDYLAELKAGWLDGDGEPVPNDVALFAYEWLTEPLEELERWAVFPLEEGGLCFERCDDRSDSVRVYSDRIVYHLMKRRGSWSAWLEVERKPPHKLLELDAGD